MTPPHDISGRVIGEYLSTSPNAEKLIAMMRESYDLLKDHPVNKKRIAEGKLPANSIWLWGEGSRPALPSFEEKFGVKGSIVSAVDLLKGIGICAGMNTPEVEAQPAISTRISRAKRMLQSTNGVKVRTLSISMSRLPTSAATETSPKIKSKQSSLLTAV